MAIPAQQPVADRARAMPHLIKMAETGVLVSYAGSPTPAAGEVLNTHVIPKMVQRVVVENWEPAKALDECQKKIVEIYTRYAKG
jgi:hypothetical protein